MRKTKDIIDEISELSMRMDGILTANTQDLAGATSDALFLVKDQLRMLWAEYYNTLNEQAMTGRVAALIRKCHDYLNERDALKEELKHMSFGHADYFHKHSRFCYLGGLIDASLEEVSERIQ